MSRLNYQLEKDWLQEADDILAQAGCLRSFERMPVQLREHWCPAPTRGAWTGDVPAGHPATEVIDRAGH
jgi:hypothetical protein